MHRRGTPRTRLRPAVAVLLAAVASLATVLVPATSARADSSACTVSPTLVNSCRAWLGATSANYPQGGSGPQNQVLYHEQRIGRQVDIVHTYHGVGDNQLSASDLFFAGRPGTTLYVNWKPTGNWADIANQNAAIDQMAASIKSLGTQRIFLTLYHEPEKSVSPGGDPNCPNVAYKGGSGTVADYRNMWQYVENRFATDGVNNVVWAMDYMNYDRWDCLVPDLYPGDQLVDWITFDAYQNASTATFSSVVGRFTQLLTNDTDAQHSFTSKPWGIAEWGTYGFSPASEIAYIDSARSALDSNAFPYIKMYMVFDENDQASSTGNSYRIGFDDNGATDTAKAAHYAAFANDSLLTGNYQPPPPPPDITPPTVSLTAPADQSAVDHSATITGTASDDRGVQDVRLLVDGADSGQDTTQTAGGVQLDWDSTTVPNGTHALALQASDAAGNVTTSNSVTVTVDNPDVTPPSVPTQVTATAQTSHSVQVNWAASTDEVGVTAYRVYRDGTPIATVSAGDGTQYLDTGLTDATTYEYTVDAVDAAGNASAASDPADATTPDETPPSDPTGLSATPTGARDVTLSWQPAQDNVGVAGYDVYRDGAYLAAVTSATSYDDSTVSDASSYTYSVTAFDQAGNTSGGAESASVSLPDATPPSAPAGLTAAATDAHTIALNWQAATDNVAVAGYEIYRDGAPADYVTDGTGYVDSGLADASTHTYAVTAVDAAGNAGDISDPASATTPDSTPPTTPARVTARAASTTAVNLQWTPATDNVGVVAYNVYRNGTLAASLGNVTSWQDTSVTGLTVYRYTVTAVDGAGNPSPASTAVSVRTPGPDTTAPTAPVTVTAGLTSTRSAVLVRWTASTDNVGIAGYLIYCDGNLLGSATPSSRSFTDSGPAQAQAHQYAVAAYDAAGNPGASTAAKPITVPDTTPPTTPTGFTLTPGRRLIVGTWSGSSDNVGVTGYYVYRNGVRIANLTTGTTFRNAGLTTGTSYTYYVVAHDAANKLSAPTATLSATAG
jgi:fibronectin type 3 domain-containing protein